MTKKPKRGSRAKVAVVRAHGTERPSQGKTLKATLPVGGKSATPKRIVSGGKAKTAKPDVVSQMKALRKHLLEANRIAKAFSRLTSGMDALQNATKLSLIHFDRKLKTLDAKISDFDTRITKVETEFYKKLDYLSGNFAERAPGKSEPHSGTRKSPFGQLSDEGFSRPVPGSFESAKR